MISILSTEADGSAGQASTACSSGAKEVEEASSPSDLYLQVGNCLTRLGCLAPALKTSQWRLRQGIDAS